jgi:hypothetical protein
MSEPIALEDAIAMLPDTEYINTYRQVFSQLIGLERERDTVIFMLSVAKSIQLAPPEFQKINHRIALKDMMGAGFVYVETKPDSDTSPEGGKSSTSS